MVQQQFGVKMAKRGRPKYNFEGRHTKNHNLAKYNATKRRKPLTNLKLVEFIESCKLDKPICWPQQNGDSPELSPVLKSQPDVELPATSIEFLNPYSIVTTST